MTDAMKTLIGAAQDAVKMLREDGNRYTATHLEDAIAAAQAEQSASVPTGQRHLCANAMTGNPGECKQWCGDKRLCPVHPLPGYGVPVGVSATSVREPVNESLTFMGEPVLMWWKPLSRDESRLALHQSMHNRTCGNPGDDKLMLEWLWENNIRLCTRVPDAFAPTPQGEKP